MLRDRERDLDLERDGDLEADFALGCEGDLDGDLDGEREPDREPDADLDLERDREVERDFDLDADLDLFDDREEARDPPSSLLSARNMRCSHFFFYLCIINSINCTNHRIAPTTPSSKCFPTHVFAKLTLLTNTIMNW